jgi:hypothetical protein
MKCGDNETSNAEVNDIWTANQLIKPKLADPSKDGADDAIAQSAKPSAG